MGNLLQDMMGLNGRINRQRWWIGIIVIAVIAFIINLILGSILGTGMMMSPADMMSPGVMQKISLQGLIIGLITAYPYLSLAVKRRHDRGNNGYDAMALIALLLIYNLIGAIGFVSTGGPIQIIFGLIFLVLGIYVLVQLAFLRGTAGPNEYGPDPLQG